MGFSFFNESLNYLFQTPIFKDLILLFLIVCVCGAYSKLWSPEDPHGAGLTGDCKPPNVGAGN